MLAIHYGAKRYDAGKHEPVANRKASWPAKPRGGLWATPETAVDAWKDWCEYNDFHLDRLIERFTVDVTNMLTIDGNDDLRHVQWTGDMIDWEELATRYDAIYVTVNGLGCTRGWRDVFDGWDVESVLILNPIV